MSRKITNTLRILAILVTVTSIAFFAPFRAAFLYLTPLSDNIQTEIERAVDAGLDGVIVYINQTGKKTGETYASGVNNRDTNQPAATDVLFKIGSISKLYIAAAVTRLADQGRLNLDASLLDYLPELASRIDNADQITLRMMVQHRSGIPNYTDHPDFPWFAPFDKANDLLQSLAFIYDKPASFEPDSDYAYSNSNYLLIGAIIDKTLGTSYQEYIAEEILKPLNLTETYGSIRDVPQQNLMSGYMSGFEDDLKELAFISAPGAMVATAKDVATFVKALNDGSLFNSHEQALYQSLYLASHDGWLLGYLSFARYDEESDTVVVLFTNTSGDEPWLIGDITCKRIQNILHNRLRQSR